MEMDLQIIVKRCDDIPVIVLKGEVDAYTSARFREVMLEVVDTHGPKVVISMADVDYIDSSGLGALVGGLKRVSERDGKIVIVCDKPQVRKVFEITGLEKVFPIFESEDAAVAGVRD